MSTTCTAIRSPAWPDAVSAWPPRCSTPPLVAHDAHFLQRLDRVSHGHVEMALGLYRDHELVRHILDNAHVPVGAERVALALADGGKGPHVIVTREGRFVTCLGEGMKTGPHPVGSRARIDALAAKVERVRAALELARKRGIEDAGDALEKLSNAGSALTREDFVAAKATIGPASGLLVQEYVDWSRVLLEGFPMLMRKDLGGGPRQKLAESTARGAWAMAHLALVLVDSASREWVESWAELPVHRGQTPPCIWLALLSAYPFVLRAAWIEARLGKPMFAPLKERLAHAEDPIVALEAGYGLLAMGLRHEGLHGDALRAMRHRVAAGRSEPWATEYTALFTAVADGVERDEEKLRAEGMELGRKAMGARAAIFEAASPHRHEDPGQVSDDLAIAALSETWIDAYRADRCTDLMVMGLACAARAPAEHFYYPARTLHGIGRFDHAAQGELLASMRRDLFGVARTVVHDQPRPGRNDPCPCGSGKKYKKCCGAG